MSRQSRLDWYSSRKTEKSARRAPRHRRTLGVQPLEARRLLAVITVDTLADTIDFNDGQTSLREAVFAANTVPGADTIQFAESLYEQSPATILLTQGEIAITDALEILGPGYRKLTIDASGSDTNLETPGTGSRIFNIDDRTGATIEVTLRGLTLTGGDSNANGGAVFSSERLTVDGVVFEKNQSRGGGAVFQAGAAATIANSQFLDNDAFSFGRGGALLVESLPSGQTVVVSDSEFSDNAAGTGGAIAIRGGSAASGAAVFERITIEQNVASSSAGGISIEADPSLQVTIRDSSISGNSAQSRGGGIWATGVGSLAIENSKLLNNDTPPGVRGGSGGGAYFANSNVSILGSTISGNEAGAGGGLLSRMGELSIRFSQFSDNQATTDRGGGIYSDRSRLSIVGSEITGNTSAATRAQFGGGGIWMSPALGANVLISDTRIAGNSAAMGNGGGIEFRTGYEGPTSPSLVLTGVTLANNNAISGGGVYVFGTSAGQLAPSVHITGGAITGNKATSAAGGGLFSTLPNLQIDGTVISENTAWGSGGGVAISANAPIPGLVTIANATFQENIASAEFNGTAAPGDGGAVWLAAPAAAVNISNSHFTNNAASRGGAIFRQANAPINPLSISGSTLYGNTALAAGGAIYNERGTLVIDRSTIEHNQSADSRAQLVGGGGVYNRMADLTITTSSISGNSATGRGGGLYHNQGDLTVSNSTIANNSSNSDGGGVYAVTSAIVDRIFVESSTVSGNTSTQTGGLYLRGHSTIRHSTIVRNTNTGGGARAGGVVAGDGSARFELDHTIVADNSVGESANPAPDLRMWLPMFNVFVRNSLIGDSRGTTLVEAPLGSPDANGNLIGKSTVAGGSGVIDPLLGPLFVNGGPTLTHALLPGSPALDAGTSISGAPRGFDQRGNPFSRMVDATGDGVVQIDIGAYESQGEPQFTPGDFNRDGFVDACDYLIWRDTFGAKDVPFAGADADGDGLIGPGDFAIWKAHFGQGLTLTTGGSAALALAAEASEPATSTAARFAPPAPAAAMQLAGSHRTFAAKRLSSAAHDQLLAWWTVHRCIPTRTTWETAHVVSDAKRGPVEVDPAPFDLAFASLVE